MICESSAQSVQCKGFWLGAPIELKMKRKTKNFIQELYRWSALNHPHVVKLLGACRGKQFKTHFFVYERPAHGSLLAYRKELEQTKALSHMWEKLYEAALGLQYLHDRNVIHGNIRCESIAVAGNGVAKLQNLGSDKTNHKNCASWTAPEVLSGLPRSFESDIFAFGMTIVEALKNGNPWGPKYTSDAIRHSIQARKLPHKPREMTTQQWQLIKRMCCYNPEDRPTTPDIVRELQGFAREYDVLRHFDQPDVILLSWSKLGDVMVGNVELGKLLVWISLMCRPDTFYLSVFDRLSDVFTQLKVRKGAPSIALVKHFSDILLSTRSKLESTSSVGPIRFAASRQVADNTFSIHADLDALMKAAHLLASNKVHEWRNQWRTQRKHQFHELLVKLRRNEENKKERNDSVASLCLEMIKYPTSYTTRTPGYLMSTSSTAFTVLNWYIPPYEVEFNSEELSRGAFGSVYKGKWKNAHVVVKKLNLKCGENLRQGGSIYIDSLQSEDPRSHSMSNKDLAIFLNEVEIWHQLYHPNVVQLYGACHAGQPFFVCEYAGGGQLDDYLRGQPGEVWSKLYEVALGLRYLHVKRVIHGDLKCNNILIGSDGLAKLTDFGLSTLNTVENSVMESGDASKVGAIRWKAPEVLRGEKAAFASDVYSFGMCILEAVSGNIPWGKVLMDTVVHYYVVKKQWIPKQPENCNESTYALVEKMCRFDPSQRMGINAVVEALKVRC